MIFPKKEGNHPVCLRDVGILRRTRGDSSKRQKRFCMCAVRFLSSAWSSLQRKHFTKLNEKGDLFSAYLYCQKVSEGTLKEVKDVKCFIP
jgi:hypothetical protein